MPIQRFVLRFETMLFNTCQTVPEGQLEPIVMNIIMQKVIPGLRQQYMLQHQCQACIAPVNTET